MYNVNKVYNKIEIRKTCIIIHNYDMGDEPRLERLFSLYNKTCHKYYFKGIYYDKENKDLYLPSGIDFFYITRSFGDDVFHKVQSDPYDKISVKIKYLPRDETQEEAVDFCLGQGKYTNNKRASQLFINLNTGKGKTFLAIIVSAIFGVKTMMIANSIELINQWKARILEYTDCTPNEVYIIAGSSSIAKLMNGMTNHTKIKYYLCSHDTLSSYANKYGYTALRELFIKLRCGIKIFDEAHLYIDSISMIDFFSDTWKTFYLTATPARSDMNENKIYQLSYKNIPKINLFNEDTDPHTQYIAIQFNSHPNPMETEASRNAYGFNLIWYANYLVTKPVYYQLLHIVMDIALNKTPSNGKSLVYIGTNYAIQTTYDWLKFYYPTVSVGIFSSLVPKEQKRMQLENKIILSTTKSAGTAMDIKGLSNTFVLDEPFKSPVLTQQTLGRTRGENTRYFDFVDTGFQSLRYYYTSKKKIFMKYATTCTEIPMNDKVIHDEVRKIQNKIMQEVAMLQQRPNLKQVVEFVYTNS